MQWNAWNSYISWGPRRLWYRARFLVLKGNWRPLAASIGMNGRRTEVSDGRDVVGCYLLVMHVRWFGWPIASDGVDRFPAAAPMSADLWLAHVCDSSNCLLISPLLFSIGHVHKHVLCVDSRRGRRCIRWTNPGMEDRHVPSASFVYGNGRFIHRLAFGAHAPIQRRSTASNGADHRHTSGRSAYHGRLRRISSAGRSGRQLQPAAGIAAHSEQEGHWRTAADIHGSPPVAVVVLSTMKARNCLLPFLL